MDSSSHNLFLLVFGGHLIAPIFTVDGPWFESVLSSNSTISQSSCPSNGLKGFGKNREASILGIKPVSGW